MRFSQALPDGRAFITTPASGTSVLTVRLLKHWCADANGRISNTTGTISLPTKLIRFQKPIAWLIPRPMRVQDECARAGPILSTFSKQPKILQELSQTNLTHAGPRDRRREGKR